MAREELLDLGNYPEIYCDGIGAIERLSGDNVRFIMFSWRMINGEYRKVIACAFVRHISTVADCQELRQFVTLAKNAPPPPSHDRISDLIVNGQPYDH